RLPVAAQSSGRDVHRRVRVEPGVAGTRVRRRIDPMNFTGVFAPVPTPFDDQDRVDTRRLASALEKWCRRPLHGFVILGSNAEAALMDDFESDRAIVAAREAV